MTLRLNVKDGVGVEVPVTLLVLVGSRVAVGVDVRSTDIDGVTDASRDGVLLADREIDVDEVVENDGVTLDAFDTVNVLLVSFVGDVVTEVSRVDERDTVAVTEVDLDVSSDGLLLDEYDTEIE